MHPASPNIQSPSAASQCCCGGQCGSAKKSRHSVPLWVLLLILPLALIGILALGFASIAVLNVGGVGNQARHAATAASMHNLGMMLKTYNLDYGVYPPNLTALVPKYADRVPTDAWKRPLGYTPLPPGGPHPFFLFSTGESGKQGDPDNIDYWTDVETKH